MDFDPTKNTAPPIWRGCLVLLTPVEYSFRRIACLVHFESLFRIFFGGSLRDHSTPVPPEGGRNSPPLFRGSGRGYLGSIDILESASTPPNLRYVGEGHFRDTYAQRVVLSHEMTVLNVRANEHPPRDVLDTSRHQKYHPPQVIEKNWSKRGRIVRERKILNRLLRFCSQHPFYKIGFIFFRFLS